MSFADCSTILLSCDNSVSNWFQLELPGSTRMSKSSMRWIDATRQALGTSRTSVGLSAEGTSSAGVGSLFIAESQDRRNRGAIGRVTWAAGNAQGRRGQDQ